MATRTITRLFDSQTDARAAVTALEAAGFPHADISIIARDTTTGTTTTTTDGEATETGAGTGATIGTVLGGGAGLLAGIGALAIPGVGPVVAAGWLVAALTGAGVGAAAGGLVGSLTGAGVDAADAEVYSEGVNRGGSLVTLRTDDTRASEAEMILDRHNAADRSTLETNYRSTGWTGSSSSRVRVGGAPDGTPGNPSGTMLSRGVDDVAGTNISGARPENETRGTASRDGTPGNPPGTEVSRALDRTAGTNVSGAYPSQSDGTAVNPPGTAAERALDRNLGTDTARRS